MVIHIAGVSLSPEKRVFIALQSIFGIGRKRAMDICTKTFIPFLKKLKELSQEDLNKLQVCVVSYVVEGELRRFIARNIKRLCDIKCYRGLRHRLSLPVRGQRTRTNASTRKKKKIKFKD